ncbi:MAG: FliO/MopB family protein [Treponema sp.]
MNFKKIIFTLAAFFCAVNLFYPQNSSKENASENEIIITRDAELENMEKQFVITDSSSAGNTAQRSSGSGGWAIIKMVLVLAIVVACIYFVMTFMKKSINGDSSADDPYLRKVAQVNLAPGKSVQVVTLLDNCYVVGVSDSSVNLIGTIEDKELINAMNLSADKASKNRKARNFGEILEMFMPSKSSRETSATQPDIYTESSRNVQDFVKTQRKRINKNKDNE